MSSLVSLLPYLFAFVGALFVLRRWLTQPQKPKAEQSNKSIEKQQKTSPKGRSSNAASPTSAENGHTITIIHASLKGTATEFAQKAAKRFTQDGFAVKIGSAAEFDPEKLAAESFVVFIVSTYEGGVAPAAQLPFFTALTDHAEDFRVHKNWDNMRYSILGLGNRLYCNVGNYCAVAKEVDRCLNILAARRATPVFLADERDGLLDPTFETWIKVASAAAQASVAGWPPAADMPKFDGALDEGKATQEKEEEDQENVETDSEGEGENGSANEKPKANALTDLEDLGQIYGKSAIDKFRRPDKTNDQDEMLNPRLRQGLTKQGYRLLGSHSGVKLCRWTKAMLRGRGGCYKHSFYGIQSYQCMEMTPSLACANKCVFCWRHHTNPVTREWRWKMDEAKWLLDQSMEQHVAMINTMKGVPGVIPERFEEAKKIRHCALSLVGEPIIYPQINEYIRMLHSRGISSFMVTNAQFPDKIEDLTPVTQVYVSIDAATKESLRKIDRPLFTDFWERFLASIDALARKQQRTVFRMTLVKSWNMDELRDYAALIERGKPEFVEVKGVTYCGESMASDLTMKNVPYHHEVVEFCKALVSCTPGMAALYDLATEHEHSCCMLVAQKKFLVDGRWHTWIDYDKFHKLANAEPLVPFATTDYMAETPAWAVYGAKEKGFDPAEVRFTRKKAEPATGGC